MGRSKALAVTPPAGLTAPRPGQDAGAWLNELIGRKTLTAEECAALVTFLDKIPELWPLFGDLAEKTRNELAATAMHGGGTALRMAVEHEADALAAELGKANAAPLERLIIDQIVCCWLNCYDVQRRYTVVMRGELSIKQADWWERRHSAAQHRYLRACESLARVRRLARSGPLQINIGGQQVNMVNPPAPEPALCTP